MSKITWGERASESNGDTAQISLEDLLLDFYFLWGVASYCGDALHPRMRRKDIETEEMLHQNLYESGRLAAAAMDLKSIHDLLYVDVDNEAKVRPSMYGKIFFHLEDFMFMEQAEANMVEAGIDRRIPV